ncbi:ABC-type glycerol-3-phosphate transport system substrate-binding protein [Streptomyces sp. B3I7]|nr:ABC-type glycerol-3-phosphate transport system substrate-binding protein [Streptomyces sp. B3I7]
MRTQSRRRPRVTLAMAAAGTLLAPLLSGCWVGAGGSGSGGDSVNVLMVNNPQMVELQKLTAAHFTKETGIKVNFTVLPENDVRDKISQDFANQAGQYDVATLSNYEIPIYARNGWLHEMNSYVAKDPSYDEKDVLKPMRQSLTGDDGKLYGQPFYGESSFLMYRKDVFAAKGLKMPAHPTWDQVADLAAKADGARSGMKGICLRGLPGWGEIMAPLTTVVNTFGGTWFDKDWKARLTDPAFEKATKFYVDLVRAHGESGAPQSGRLRRVPEQPHPGQGRHVVRRHLRGRFPGGGQVPGQGQDRLRAGAGREDRVLGLALHLGLGHAEGLPQHRQGVEVRLVGLQQGVRAARR